MWKSAENLFSDNLDKVNAKDIWLVWSQPPFGLKRGLFPLMLFLFMITNRNRLAIYHENIYVTELSDASIEWLIKHPDQFSFLIINYNEIDGNLRGYANAISSIYNSAILPLPLEIGRSLKIFLKKQADWVRGTKLLSKKTEVLRDEIKKANDPIDLVLKIIPRLYGEDYSEFKLSLKEIIDFYPNKLNELKKQMFTSFHLNNEKNRIEILKERASILKGKTGDLKLNPFIVNLERLDPYPDSMERILYAIIQKNPKQLIDQDFDLASIELNWFVERFLIAEAHSKVSKRKKYSSSISMIYGGSDNKEPKNLEVSINRSHLKKIKSLTEKIENVINDNYQDDLFKGQNDDKSILVGALSNILEISECT